MATPTGDWQTFRAARALRSGGLVAYPTEAVWGLGCDPANDQALARLLNLKQRPWQKGLILIAANWAQLAPWLKVSEAPEIAAAHWPGHATFLLPARDEVSTLLRGRHDTLAVRISAHPPVRALCESFGGAIVSTSANRHGRPTPTSIRQLRHQLGPGLDFVLNAPLGQGHGPSRIMDPYSGEVIRA
ncbi:SUA5/YciO/YrdC-like protein [Oceanococcus atlanticus]|uniref:Threonylcarbamoyl-AMP synthase n=1 Tax=Oceanococcus atlanticus TaxID=1317117 RepID=A0A1Y1SAP3_9GAMM|nr:SUA5/YciO/YrdC-like protein [Oceanococcus atlanticus]